MSLKLPKIIKSIYNYIPNRKRESTEGHVLHAISEYVSREGLKYVFGYNKANDTFNGKNINEYDEWIKCNEWLSLIGNSVHHFIYPDGIIEQCIDNDNVAFHAGRSRYNGISGLNNYYLGTEIVLPGKNNYGEFLYKINNTNWVSDEQYDSINYLVNEIKNKYNYSEQNIIGHNQCSGDNIRGKGKGKQDPGNGFNWKKVEVK
jgi:N-acetyl-anhydromuramyl-L-alanine amidase AmpD